MSILLTSGEVEVLRRQGRIWAIKKLRERLALGLREAKLAVDSYAVALGLLVAVTCQECGGSGKQYQHPNGAKDFGVRQ